MLPFFTTSFDYQRIRLCCFSVLTFLILFSSNGQSRVENDLDSLRDIFDQKAYPSNVEALLSAGKILLRQSLDSAKSTYRLAGELAKEGSILQAESFSYEGICWAFLGFSDTASYRLSKALYIAKKFNDYDLTTKIYSNMGINFSISSQYDSALLLFEEYLELAKKENHLTDIASASNNLGLLHLNKGNYYQSLSRFVEAENVFFEQKDTAKLSSVYLNIAIIHRDLENYYEAITYSRKSIILKQAMEDKRGLINIYINLATVYGHLDLNDSVEYYLDKAEPLAIETDDLLSQISISYTRMRLYSESERAELSTKIGEEALTLLNNKLDNLNDLSRVKIELARAYAYESNLEKARKLVDDGLQISLDNDLDQISVLGFEVKSIILKLSGDYLGAYQAYKRHSLLSDSISSTRKSKVMSELEVEFETEQKERRILEQDLEIANKESALKSQRIQIGFLSTSIILVMLIGSVIYFLIKNKQKLRLYKAVSREKENGFKAVITATEEERKRIAKDLHDGVVQQIAAVKLTLANVLDKLPDKEKVEVEKAKIIAEAAAEETRNLSHQMMPKVLIEVGLMPAMEEVINNVLLASEVKVDFQQHGLKDRYENRIEIAVYRIFQELVNNIIKHSNAKQVDIQLMENAGKLMLIVEDDGVGMNGENHNGIGLSNIQSRLTTIDGKVNYESGNTSGTVATIVIPL